MMLTPSPRACARTSRKVAVLAGVVLVGIWGTAAYAHGGVAEIHINEATPGDGSVAYEVHSTWEDGDPIEDAQVTATATGPSGEQQTPVTMEHTEGGVYQGTVETPDPGSWGVQFTLLHPDAGEPATATDTQEIEAQAAPEPTTTEPPATESEPETADLEASEEAAASEEAQAEEDDDSVSLILVAAVFLVVGAVVGAAFWAAVGGRKHDDDYLDDTRTPERESAGMWS